jgi:hypothetical protein
VVLPLLAGLLGALVLFVAAAPVHRRLTSRLSTRVSATVIVAATAVLIFLPAAWLLSVAVDRAPDAINQLRDSTVWARLSAMRFGSIDIGTRLADAGGSIISFVSSQALRVVGSAMRGTINAVVALFGLYFLLTATRDAWLLTTRELEELSAAPMTPQVLDQRVGPMQIRWRRPLAPGAGARGVTLDHAKRFGLHPAVVARRDSDQLVVMNLDTEFFYRMDGPATGLAELLSDDLRSLDEIGEPLRDTIADWWSKRLLMGVPAADSSPKRHSSALTAS